MQKLVCVLLVLSVVGCSPFIREVYLPRDAPTSMATRAPAPSDVLCITQSGLNGIPFYAFEFSYAFNVVRGELLFDQTVDIAVRHTPTGDWEKEGKRRFLRAVPYEPDKPVDLVSVFQTDPRESELIPFPGFPLDWAENGLPVLTYSLPSATTIDRDPAGNVMKYSIIPVEGPSVVCTFYYNASWPTTEDIRTTWHDRELQERLFRRHSPPPTLSL